MARQKTLNTRKRELIELGWELVDGCDTQILVADKFGPGCRVGAFVDVDGMDVFRTKEDDASSAPYYIYFKNVSTMPSPEAAARLLGMDVFRIHHPSINRLALCDAIAGSRLH